MAATWPLFTLLDIGKINIVAADFLKPASRFWKTRHQRAANWGADRNIDLDHLRN